MRARIRQNIWGNWNGYVGTRKVREFGTDEREAAAWLEKQAKYERGSKITLRMPFDAAAKIADEPEKFRRFMLDHGFEVTAVGHLILRPNERT
jgi:hypothetical protein